jgi:hypothetical protein
MAFATALGIWATPRVWTAIASRRWTRTPAELLSAGIIPTQRSLWSSGAAYTEYFLSVRFRYTVDGQVLESDQLDFGGEAYRSESEAVAAREALRTQAPLYIYYNPRRPQVSVLRPGTGGALSLLIWSVMAMFFTGLYLAWFK